MKSKDIDILLLNILRGCADEEEILFFSQWVRDEDNSKYFETIKQAWTISESLSFNIPVNQAGRNQLLGKIVREGKKLRLRRIVAASVSMAAILAALYFFVGNYHSDNELFEYDQIVSENKLTEKINSNDVTIISSSIKGEVVKVTKISESVIENNDVAEIKDTLTPEVEINTLFVPKGKRILVILSDGTKMWVNSDSKVVYPAVFPKDKRALEVIGNVFFEVTKDKTRPFEVTINDVKTIALGTQFEVNNYQSGQCSVALVEGLVSVENGYDKLIVEPSNYVVSRVGSDKLSMKKFDVKLCGLWRDNILAINNEPIASIIEKLIRWHNIEIVNRTFGLEKICFTGKLHEAALEDHLKIISDNIKIKFTKEGDKMVVWN